MANSAVPPPTRPPQPESPPPGHVSWPMLLVLGAMLLGMWLWRSSIQQGQHPEIEYSTFYQWAEQNKVKSVTIQGQQVTGTLKNPEKVQEQNVELFRTVLPQGDDKLLPLLREKQVSIRVATEGQPFAVEVLLSILPWALII